MYYIGRGQAATKGWKLEQLVYASLSVIFAEDDIQYQYVSPHIKCTPDFLVRLSNKNMIISITSGPDKVAKRYTSNSKYPFWETIAELFYIKTSDDPNIDAQKDICINIIFGRKDFWVPWLISGFEVVFDDNFFAQYKDGNFYVIEKDLNSIYLNYRKENKETKTSFKNYLIEVIQNLPSGNGVKIAFENLVNYWKTVEDIGVKPFHELWGLEKKRIPDMVPAIRLLDEQLWKYGEPIDRLSFRWYFIVKAAFSNNELSIMKTLLPGEKNVEEICRITNLQRDEVVSTLKYLQEIGVVVPHDNTTNPSYSLNPERPEIIKVIGLTPPLDEKLAEKIIVDILRERSGELRENVQVIKEWNSFFSRIRKALTLNRTQLFNELVKIWNIKEYRSVYRKLLLDMANLKQNEFMDILGIYSDQIIFYYREFTEEETRTVINRILSKLEQKYGNLPHVITTIEADTRVRFAVGRIWSDLNNPKLNPYLKYMDAKLSQIKGVKVKKGVRFESFFRNLIISYPHFLKTYPQHASEFPPNSGIVESHFIIEKEDKLWFLKSRYADFDSIDHRRPEECGRCKSIRYDFDVNTKTFLPRKNISFIFIPDGCWREEDLWLLIESGYTVYLTIEEFINKELL